MRFLIILAMLLPLTASAQDVSSDGITPEMILYALIGAFGAASVVVFIGGLIVYLTRLGTERREEGIHIMEWGASILLVVFLCIGILHWLTG